MVSKKVTSEEQISPRVLLRTNDLILEDAGGLEDPSKVSGFLYELSTGPERDVSFHIDITGSENLLLEGGGLLRKSEVPASSSSFPVAQVQVVDLDKPWSLQCRYTWTEKEATVKEISKDILLETTDLWTKGCCVTAIAYKLKVTMAKRVVFDVSFDGSENLELATGGMRLRTVVEPHSAAPVGYLQVIDPSVPWSLKCKYEWSEEAPAAPVLDMPERRELAPGIVLRTVRSDAGNGDTFTYELACSKNVVIDVTLDCSNSRNMALKDGGVQKRTVVQPWDRAVVGIVAVIEPAKPHVLKCKLTWSERSPKPPGVFAASAAATEKREPVSGVAELDAVSGLADRVASVDLNDARPERRVVETERSSTTTLDQASSPTGSPIMPGDVAAQALPSRVSNISLAFGAEDMPTPPPAPVATADPPVQVLQHPRRAAPGLKLDLGADSDSFGGGGEPPGVVRKPAPVVAATSNTSNTSNTAKKPPLRTTKMALGSASGPAIQLSLPKPPPAPAPSTGPGSEGDGEAEVDTKEIAPQVFLTTYQVRGAATRIVYMLEVKKPARLEFTVDFTGSKGLVLSNPSSGNPLVRRTTVPPYDQVTVAELAVGDATPGVPWSLRCKYSFEEHEVVISAAQAQEPPAAPTTGGEDDLATFLASVGLSDLLETFQSEQVDLPLLLELARNVESLRSTLKELGVIKLGPREKIVTALRKRLGLF